MLLLKRVEEAYLGVLRLIIISAASLLLIAAAVFAVLASINLASTNKKVPEAIAAVNPEEITQGVISDHAEATPATKAPSEKSDGKADTDPNQAEFDRAAVVILNFVKQHGKGRESLDKTIVLSVLINKAAPYQGTADAKPFAAGLAQVMEKSLSDPKLVKLVAPQKATQAPPPAAPAASDDTATEAVTEAAPQEPAFKVSPIDVINGVLNKYVSAFSDLVKQREQAKEDAVAAGIQSKGEMMTQLYVAGGLFGAFLCLVFISIVVKIERNLRVLTVPAAVGRDSDLAVPEQS